MTWTEDRPTRPATYLRHPINRTFLWANVAFIELDKAAMKRPDFTEGRYLWYGPIPEPGGQS